VAGVVDLVTAPSTTNNQTTSISSNQNKRKRNDAPTNKRHGIKTNKTTNKKIVVSEGRPRNDAERDALKKKKGKQTMMAFINFPPGRKTKPKSTQQPAYADGTNAFDKEGHLI
jgi:hypothetical protein